MKNYNELQQTVALSLVDGLGPVKFKKLLEAFGSVPAIFKTKTQELLRVEGLTSARIKEMRSEDLFKKAEIEIKKALDGGVEIITFFDERYPAMLKEIYAPPMLLYVKGRLPKETSTNIAIVGSRIASLYGQRMAKLISKELAEAGLVVVSGLAIGIDTAAHQGALAGDGVTVAVLGGGINKLYPAENKKLADEILNKGAIISEYPMDMSPEPGYFPVRNRIVSGLSRAVLVVEAKDKSGALITADIALEQGRDVFAVPGNVDSARSQGTNNLLKQGAKLVTSAKDILEELKIRGDVTSRTLSKNISLTEEEKNIFTLLEGEPVHVDTLIDHSGLAVGKAIAVVSGMEIKGLIKQLPGKIFVRK